MAALRAAIQKRWMSVAWVVSLVGYSVVRALAVAPLLGPYGINPWWFLGIDVGSAAPLAIGQVQAIKALRAGHAAGVQRWVLLVTVSFLSPYAYLVFGAGRPLPSVAYYVLGALVAILGGATAYRIRQEAQKLADDQGA